MITEADLRAMVATAANAADDAIYAVGPAMQTFLDELGKAVVAVMAERDQLASSLSTVQTELQQHKDALAQAQGSIRKLAALEAAGVDNWEWYGDAMAELYGDDEEDEG